jgi:hypothetical protein
MFCGEIIADDCLMQEILSQIDIKSGTNRRKLCKEGESALYGSTWMTFLKYDTDGNKVFRPPDPDNPTLGITKLKELYPELQEVFEEYRDLYFPHFQFKSVMINKNYQVGRHLDAKNVGESFLVTFGDFENGKTRLWNRDNEYEDLDSRDNPISFDGSKFYHECLPFTGTRYALVFFK